MAGAVTLERFGGAGRIGAAAILGVAGGYLTWAVLITVYSLDLPLMHFIAARSLAGETPYRDLWDMNGPAIYQIHMVLALAPGEPIRVLQGFALVVFAVALLAGWRIASGAGRAPVVGALMMATLALWFATCVLHVMGQRDVIIAMMAVVALALMLEPGARAPRWAIAGFLLGFAVGVKPVAAPYALAAFVASLTFAGSWTQRTARAVWLTAGGVAGGLVWFGWLAAIGALDDWWTIMSAFNGEAYVAIGRAPTSSLVLSPTLFAAVVGAGLLSAARISPRTRDAQERAATKGEQSEQANQGDWLILAFLASAAMAFVAQGKGWPYHQAPVWLFAAVAAGAGLSRLGEGRIPVLAATGLALLAALSWLPALANLHSPAYRDFLAERARNAAAMRAAIEALPAGMKVQALDTTDGALQAMYEAGRTSASPVLYDFWLFEGTEESRERARKAVLDALRQEPSAILVTNQGWPNPQRSGFERLSAFPELEGLIHDRYRLAAEGDHGWESERLRFRLYEPAL